MSLRKRFRLLKLWSVKQREVVVIEAKGLHVKKENTIIKKRKVTKESQQEFKHPPQLDEELAIISSEGIRVKMISLFFFISHRVFIFISRCSSLIINFYGDCIARAKKIPLVYGLILGITYHSPRSYLDIPVTFKNISDLSLQKKKKLLNCLQLTSSKLIQQSFKQTSHTVTLQKNLHMQKGGVWMAAWLDHAVCQLQSGKNVFSSWICEHQIINKKGVGISIVPDLFSFLSFSNTSSLMIQLVPLNKNIISSCHSYAEQETSASFLRLTTEALEGSLIWEHNMAPSSIRMILKNNLSGCNGDFFSCGLEITPTPSNQEIFSSQILKNVRHKWSFITNILNMSVGNPVSGTHFPINLSSPGIFPWHLHAILICAQV
ncbi:hypothetical protein VP01_5198g1 [Puccinia sorghi]|uniref:Uncharacterized protein n=1 Tax=Puccinia sorghi TaxID=27349 RepID=A0A0L6UKQ3_9BASI|nr:hypothetical protein VP01_5198g1 [Puccinia sorghi]